MNEIEEDIKDAKIKFIDSHADSNQGLVALQCAKCDFILVRFMFLNLKHPSITKESMRNQLTETMEAIEVAFEEAKKANNRHQEKGLYIYRA